MGAFDGFRELLSGNSTAQSKQQSFTLKDFERTVQYLNSDEYYQINKARYLRYAESLTLIGYALQQGIITEAEHLMLLYKLEEFGELAVSPHMGEKLKRVTVPSPELHREIPLPQGFYLLHLQDDTWYAWNSTDSVVFTRVAGPYSDEDTARKWCQEQYELLLAIASGKEAARKDKNHDELSKYCRK